jgi:hypothetical protein
MHEVFELAITANMSTGTTKTLHHPESIPRNYVVVKLR